MKRPLSLTIIAWVLIVFSLLGLASIFMIGSNPEAMKMMEQMPVSLEFQKAWTDVGTLNNLAVAYVILKGQQWTRVLYAVWGAIGVVAGFYITPMKVMAMIGLIIFVVVCAFLFSNRANEWFSARGFALKRER
jgi:uncharacterized membrane protein